MAKEVAACNGVAHPVVAGGVGVPPLKLTWEVEAAVHEDSGIEVTCKSIAEEPLATARTDLEGIDSHEIVVEKHREEPARNEPLRRRQLIRLLQPLAG